MAAYFDDNDWQENSEEKLRYFYEEFSASVRKQLIHKNLLAPQNVYDVLYPRTRDTLLAKNVVKITDLEESSKSIRDFLLSKLVSENLDLEKISEDTRNSLLARNKIIQDADKLLNDALNFRKDNLSKNVPNNGDLLNDSKSFLQNNLSANVPDGGDLLTDSAAALQKNLAPNKPDGGDLLTDSKDIRQNNLSANISDEGDLLRDSAAALQNNLSANKPDGGDLLTDSKSFLQNNLSANKPDGGDLLSDSEVIRQNNLSANVPDGGDLLTDSAAALQKNLAPNKPDGGDLLTDSQSYLQNNLSANVPDGGDLLTDSAATLQKNLAPNKPDGGDLLTDSAATLQKNLAPNKPDGGDLLTDSNNIRKDNLSANVPDGGDLLTDSKSFLQNNLASNKLDSGDLLTDSKSFLQNNLAPNKPDGGDLLTDSQSYLQNNLSANKPDGGDLLTDSNNIRKDNLSANKPDSGDLLTDSATALQNNLSANKPDSGDLLTDSAIALQNNLSANKPDGGDLLIDSKPFLQNNLAQNKPDGGDLLLDSTEFLANNLAPNVPDKGDLLNDSATFLINNLAPNVPDNGDLLTDSAPFLINNLTSNVPDNGDLLNDSALFLNNNLASNVPDNGDLLKDSLGFLKDNLAHNVSTGGDLLHDSTSFLQNNLAPNVPKPFSLDSYSKAFRNNNLSRNPPVDSLGVVIEGLGTSAFLGVSRVLTQGILIRQILLSKNKKSKHGIDNFVSVVSYVPTTPEMQKDYLFSKNKYQYGTGNEYGETSTNLAGADFSKNKLFGYGLNGRTVRESINDNFIRAVNTSQSVSQQLQLKYGTNTEVRLLESTIGGGFYATDSIARKGGYFIDENAYEKMSIITSTRPGSTTDAIRNYNLSRNLYNLYRITPGDLGSLDELQANNDEGFQDLIAKTIGFFGGNNGVGAQLQSNLMPRALLVSNQGAYIKGGSPENNYRPEEITKDQIGTAASMMVKTVGGNPLEDIEFQSGTKGVVHIIRTIRAAYKGGDSDVTMNYNVQGEKDSILGRKFVIGVKPDGAPLNARKRFSVSNPYKPDNAKKVQFFLQNYSSGESYYFPPYIQDYSDSYGANWNAVNFLGRPEPVFTYNNSTRDGNITFMVLTDYAQNLVIGRDYSKDAIPEIKVSTNKHFTTIDSNANAQKTQLITNQAQADKVGVDKDLQAQKQKQAQTTQSGASQTDASTQAIISELTKNSNSIQQSINDILADGNDVNVYKETNAVIGNVNDFMTSRFDRTNGDIDTKAQDSKERIDQMVKNLAFQPAFFSGDKVDFLTKMDFLAKLTRPAKANDCSGFSFTRPPVCHIHLGDWWSNDIVIDSVSFNYTDAPWTLDDGRTQPMWATVSMSFKFIGPYRGQQGGPVLSNDVNGLYAPRGTASSSIK